MKTFQEIIREYLNAAPDNKRREEEARIKEGQKRDLLFGMKNQATMETQTKKWLAQQARARAKRAELTH